MPKASKTELPGADLLFGSHAKKTATEVKDSIDLPEKKENTKIAAKNIDVESTEPVKFTFYFDPQILEDLEVAKFRLRMEKRIKISKSDIVNAALEYCMKDLNFLERMVKGELG